MSAIAARPAVAPRERATLEVYRDDGPLARALGAIGTRVPLPPVALIGAGLAAPVALMIAEGHGAGKGAVGAAIAWLVLLGGLSSGRPHADRLRWAAPAGVRLSEYATIIWIGALAGASSQPAAFALLCALAFRHYDLVYRLRHQGTTPPGWVGDAALGWEGRVVAAYLLWIAGAVPAAFFVTAGVLAVLFVVESIASWRRWGRTQQPVLYDDEEDAAE
jgi:hypothetical protein